MSVLWPSYVFCKVTELFCEDEQDFILVVKLILQERDQLVARALRTERERDRRQPTNG